MEARGGGARAYLELVVGIKRGIRCVDTEEIGEDAGEQQPAGWADVARVEREGAGAREAVCVGGAAQMGRRAGLAPSSRGAPCPSRIGVGAGSARGAGELAAHLTSLSWCLSIFLLPSTVHSFFGSAGGSSV
jgi:hypothetical protein